MVKRMDIHRAAQDLQRHTLARIPRAIDRLIYLASTRDYNTGVYYHDGLASRFGEDIACQALADCHREAFQELVSSSLQDLTEQLEGYQRQTRTNPREFATARKKLEPYRVAIPVESDPVLTEFFFSNIRVALAIFETRLNGLPLPPSASPRLSLGQ